MLSVLEVTQRVPPTCIIKIDFTHVPERWFPPRTSPSPARSNAALFVGRRCNHSSPSGLVVARAEKSSAVVGLAVAVGAVGAVGAVVGAVGAAAVAVAVAVLAVLAVSSPSTAPSASMLVPPPTATSSDQPA